MYFFTAAHLPLKGVVFSDGLDNPMAACLEVVLGQQERRPVLEQRKKIR
jgi:hypothetical protein